MGADPGGLLGSRRQRREISGVVAGDAAFDDPTQSRNRIEREGVTRGCYLHPRGGRVDTALDDLCFITPHEPEWRRRGGGVPPTSVLRLLVLGGATDLALSSHARTTSRLLKGAAPAPRATRSAQRGPSSCEEGPLEWSARQALHLHLPPAGGRLSLDHRRAAPTCGPKLHHDHTASVRPGARACVSYRSSRAGSRREPRE